MAARILLVLLVPLLGAVAGCERGDEAGRATLDPPPETIRYTALGDSLATGTGAGTSYVAEYAEWMEEETGSRVAVTNLAVDGWTSQDLLEALRGDERMRSAVAASHVVTWDIGGNDLLAVLPSFLEGTCGGSDGQACLRAAVDTAVGNAEAALEELLDLRDGDATGVRTLDLYLPFVGDPRLDPHLDELRPHLDRFNEQFAHLSRARGVAVAEVHRAFHGPEGVDDPVAAGWISDDGIHPSERGHEAIAEALAALGVELGRPRSPT